MPLLEQQHGASYELTRHLWWQPACAVNIINWQTCQSQVLSLIHSAVKPQNEFLLLKLIFVPYHLCSLAFHLKACVWVEVDGGGCVFIEFPNCIFQFGLHLFGVFQSLFWLLQLNLIRHDAHSFCSQRPLWFLRSSPACYKRPDQSKLFCLRTSDSVYTFYNARKETSELNL